MQVVHYIIIGSISCASTYLSIFVVLLIQYLSTNRVCHATVSCHLAFRFGKVTIEALLKQIRLDILLRSSLSLEVSAVDLSKRRIYTSAYRDLRS